MSRSIEQLAKSGKLSKLENLSPLAIQQLRILARETNDGSMHARALMRDQRKLAQEKGDLQMKLEPLLEERARQERVKESYRDHAALEEANAAILPIERRMHAIQQQLAVIKEEREGIETWRLPAQSLLASVLSFMRAPRAEEFFPGLPHDNGQIF